MDTGTKLSLFFLNLCSTNRGGFVILYSHLRAIIYTYQQTTLTLFHFYSYPASPRWRAPFCEIGLAFLPRKDYLYLMRKWRNGRRARFRRVWVYLVWVQLPSSAFSSSAFWTAFFVAKSACSSNKHALFIQLFFSLFTDIGGAEKEMRAIGWELDVFYIWFDQIIWSTLV